MKKDKAIELRKQGLTYNEISQRLKVPKSTLSYWFKSLSFNDKIKEKNYNKLQKLRSKTLTEYNINRARQSRQKNLREQKEAARSINRINNEQLKLIGTALYWAEGYKKTRWSIIFVNSEPVMIRIMMIFFQKVCKVPLNKIKGQVQLHPNVSDRKATHYWSKVSGIPVKQFRKPLITVTSSSKGKRHINTLPHGTFRIIINDVRIVNIIKGWIAGISKQYAREGIK